jgi:hypothetical protein
VIGKYLSPSSQVEKIDMTWKGGVEARQREIQLNPATFLRPPMAAGW